MLIRRFICFFIGFTIFSLATVTTEFTVGTQKPFEIVNPPETRNIFGDYAIAGNTVTCLYEYFDDVSMYNDIDRYFNNSENINTDLSCKGDDASFLMLTNYDRFYKYIDIDENNKTWNSSSSFINIPSTYDDNTGILWAGLFWQGAFTSDDGYQYLLTWQQETFEDGFYGLLDHWNGYDEHIPIADQPNLLKARVGNIRLKVNNGAYRGVTATNVHSTDTKYIPYSSYADVTSILRSEPIMAGKNVFTVANLVTMTGLSNTYNTASSYDGQYGAWSIVVIYGTNPNETNPKNISVYHGYSRLLSADQDFTISGFTLPQSGQVNATMSILAGEGEYAFGYNSSDSDYFDSLKISNSPDSGYDYPDGCTDGTGLGNCQNMFDGFLTGILRDYIPNKFNNQSINNNSADIDRYDVSNLVTSYRDGDSSTHELFIKAESNYDSTILSMLSFATDIFTPKICYDYTISSNGVDITDSSGEERSFQTSGEGPIDIGVVIKSLDGDFDFEHSKLSIKTTTTPIGIVFESASYSANDINAYSPTVYSNEHTDSKPSISIGEGNPLDSTGGTVKKGETYYSSFRYNHKIKSSYSGKFEIELNVSIDFEQESAPKIFSSENGFISRCAQTDKYEPVYGTFNVERIDSRGVPYEKYPLFTQIVGKKFDLAVVAYDNPPGYDQEKRLEKGYSASVELINTGTYSDVNSTFTCNNPDPSIIQTLTSSGDKQVFAHFSYESRVKILDLRADRALKNAAFRVWSIVDSRGNMVPYDCESASDDQCFQRVYSIYLEHDDEDGLCRDCSSYINSASQTSGCYACLRDYFSEASCSRDNFSIRPLSYRLDIADTDEKINPSSVNRIIGNNPEEDIPIATLAAGYKYRLSGYSANFKGEKAKGYTTVFDNTDNLSSKLHFNGNSSSYDTSDTPWDIHFDDGEIKGNSPEQIEDNNPELTIGSLVSHNNVGIYRYNLHDSDWTMVDQKRYGSRKTFPTNDCLPESNVDEDERTGMAGCDINSNYGGESKPRYTDLDLKYQPYSFDLSDIKVSTKPEGKYLLMTDLGNPYYNTVESLSNPMSVVYEGNITAMSKEGNITTNFTWGVMASRIKIDIGYKSVPNRSIMLDKYGSFMKQYLYHSDNISYSYVSAYSGFYDLTIPAIAFQNTTPYGSARFKVRVGYRKPQKDILEDMPNSPEGVEPIDINFSYIRARGDDARSSAHMSQFYAPIGRQDDNLNVTFLYTKVSPSSRAYTTEESSIATPLSIIAYCPFSVAECSNFDLNSTATMVHESADWYFVDGIFGNNIFGNTNFNISEQEEDVSHGYSTDTALELSGDSGLRIENAAYNIDGRQLDLQVNLTGNRPTKSRIRYTSGPWLEYDIGEQFYDVLFPAGMEPAIWTGYNKTGNVVEGEINTKKSNRLEW